MLLSENARQNKAEASREYVLLDAVRPECESRLCMSTAELLRVLVGSKGELALSSRAAAAAPPPVKTPFSASSSRTDAPS